MKDRWFVGFKDNFSAKSVVLLCSCCIRVILVIEKRARKPFSLGDVPCGFRRKKTMMRPLFATKSRFIFKEGSALVKDTLRSCQLLGHDSLRSLVNKIITRMFAQQIHK